MARSSTWISSQLNALLPSPDPSARSEFGYRIPRPSGRVSHWSAYLRPGLFAFYRDLIRARHDLPIACLRHVLPDQSAPRWSRLLRRPEWNLSLPWRRPVN